MPAVLERMKEPFQTASLDQPIVPRVGKHRKDAAVDVAAIEQAVRTILSAVGEDPDREGLLETPRRVAKMYAEMFSGLAQDPARHLRVTFPEIYDEMVLVRDIRFTSMCEHHLLPFSGVAHVAYIPNGRVTGLSKLARVVDEVARRPQVQERLTQQVADLRVGISQHGSGGHHQCRALLHEHSWCLQAGQSNRY